MHKIYSLTSSNENKELADHGAEQCHTLSYEEEEEETILQSQAVL